MNILKEIERLKDARDLINSATTYTKSYLVFNNNSCDSGDDQSYRIKFVKIAEEQFVDNHRKEILQLAADNIKKELETIKTTIEKIKD